MKIKFKYFILVISTLLLGLNSCSKVDNPKGDPNEIPKEEELKDNLKSVSLKISVQPFSYSGGQPKADVPVAFNSGHLYFTNSGGVILKYYTVTSNETSAANINIATLTESGVTISSLPDGISDVYVVGNTAVYTTAGPIELVKNRKLHVTTQKDIAKVNLYGTTQLVKASDNKYTASVIVTPTIARIELSEIKASGIITSFEVAGIFVDNFYSDATIHGAVDSTKLVNNRSVSAIFSDNTPEYPTALKASIYDWYSPALASESNIVKPSDGKSWSYNVFVESNVVPRIIIRLKNVETAPGSGITYTGDQFVTIKGLNHEGVSSTNIESGKIYNRTYTFNESDMTSAPNQVMTLGTYASLPRLAKGRTDIPKLISQLNELNANTYNWLIWQGENDWDDLKLFMPFAEKNNISVWVTLVPPSESKPFFDWNSEPYGLDYVKWSQEIAKLSVLYPNLTALSIDDFTHNLKTYTPKYLGEMIDEIHKVNPELKFIPCSYYRQISQDFANKYGSLIDGLLFPYRAESEGANLKNPDLVESEIAHIRSLFVKKLPIYIDIYLSAHSSYGATTPAYVEKVIKDGGEYADGVMIYTHPNPLKFPEKYKIVKDEFARLSNL